jgi:hypothetical protein
VAWVNGPEIEKVAAAFKAAIVEILSLSAAP